MEDNHFLFRVYTPKDRSPFFDDSEPFFIGTRFDERYRETPDELREWDSYGLGPLAEAMGYPDVARHLTWTTRRRKRPIDSFAMAFPVMAKLLATYVQKMASEDSEVLNCQKFWPSP